MKKLNIGQIMTVSSDLKVEAGLSQTSSTIRKGTQLFVGAEQSSPHFFHLLNGKMLMINPDEYQVMCGFSVNGLAEWLYQFLSRRFPIDEMLEECAYDDDEDDGVDDFKEAITEALEELGMYEWEERRI